MNSWIFQQQQKTAIDSIRAKHLKKKHIPVIIFSNYQKQRIKEKRSLSKGNTEWTKKRRYSNGGRRHQLSRYRDYTQMQTRATAPKSNANNRQIPTYLTQKTYTTDAAAIRYISQLLWRISLVSLIFGYFRCRKQWLFLILPIKLLAF